VYEVSTGFRLTLNAMYLLRWYMPPLCVHILNGVGKAGAYYQGPNILWEFLPFSQQYHLSTVQINPFRPSPIHSTKSQCFKFSVKIWGHLHNFVTQKQTSEKFLYLHQWKSHSVYNYGSSACVIIVILVYLSA